MNVRSDKELKNIRLRMHGFFLSLKVILVFIKSIIFVFMTNSQTSKWQIIIQLTKLAIRKTVCFPHDKNEIICMVAWLSEIIYWFLNYEKAIQKNGRKIDRVDQKTFFFQPVFGKPNYPANY